MPNRALIRAGTFGLILATLPSCATVSNNFSEKLQGYDDNEAVIDAAKAKSFIDNQIALMQNLEGLSPPVSNNWLPTVHAGMHYVNVRCRKYIDAIFWLDRARGAATRQTQLLGAASSAALTLLEASKELIGLTPLGFTLINETLDNLGDSFLFSLPPASLLRLLEEQQRAYEAGLSKEYTNRFAALRAIQGYAELCLSINLEAAAIAAVNRSTFKPAEKPAAQDSVPNVVSEGEASLPPPPPPPPPPPSPP